MSDIEGVISFKNGKQNYKMYFGMRAYKAVEEHYDLPFLQAVQSVLPDLKAEDLDDKKKIAEASAKVRFSDVARLFEYALLKHQPNISETDVEDLIDDLGLDKATGLLGDAIGAALVGGEGEADPNPPKAASRKR